MNKKINHKTSKLLSQLILVDLILSGSIIFIVLIWGAFSKKIDSTIFFPILYLNLNFSGSAALFPGMLIISIFIVKIAIKIFTTYNYARSNFLAELACVIASFVIWPLEIINYLLIRDLKSKIQEKTKIQEKK